MADDQEFEVNDEEIEEDYVDSDFDIDENEEANNEEENIDDDDEQKPKKRSAVVLSKVMNKNQMS